MKSYWLVLISLSLLLSACAPALINDEMEQEMNEEIVPTPTETSTLPTLDVKAPAVYQTATFAMG